MTTYAGDLPHAQALDLTGNGEQALQVSELAVVPRGTKAQGKPMSPIAPIDDKPITDVLPR